MTAVAERPTDMLGRELDPYADVKRGDIWAGEVGEDRATCGTDYHPYGYCRRKRGHPTHWQHIAVTGDANRGVVVATWHDDAALDESDAPAEEEKEETPLMKIEPGALCRFRNRRDLIVVLDKTQRGGDTVEALNLTRQRFCRLKIDRLVERKPDDPDPTAEQMAWVAEFLADRKKAIAQIGQREVTSRRWSRREMEESLGKADITPPPLKWSGRISMELGFEGKPGDKQPDQVTVQKALREVFAALKDKEIEGGIKLGELIHAIPVGMVAS